jgi:hypothetical protein
VLRIRTQLVSDPNLESGAEPKLAPKKEEFVYVESSGLFFLKNWKFSLEFLTRELKLFCHFLNIFLTVNIFSAAFSRKKSGSRYGFLKDQIRMTQSLFQIYRQTRKTHHQWQRHFDINYDAVR